MENALTQIKINEIPPEDRSSIYNNLEEFLAIPESVAKSVGEIVIKAVKAPMIFAKQDEN